ncbi:MAG TPA: TetR/AcrR family transcriptional regulator [Polyangia bacterium]
MVIPSSQKSNRARKRAAAPGAVSVDDARQQILDAALAAFAARGFHGTSIPEIAGAAGVGVASIYRRFASKEHLVNAVFRDAKSRLRDALLLGLELARPPRALFLEVWARLVRFQRAQPVAFQFLEMQDHVPYLDGESRALEASLLLPILVATEAATGAAHRASAGRVPPPVLIAMIWGAFVGIVKATRLGYLATDEATLLGAGEVSWAAVASTFAKENPHAQRRR